MSLFSQLVASCVGKRKHPCFVNATTIVAFKNKVYVESKLADTRVPFLCLFYWDARHLFRINFEIQF